MRLNNKYVTNEFAHGKIHSVLHKVEAAQSCNLKLNPKLKNPNPNL